MFKFTQSPAYWWPVTLLVAPADDPGKRIEVKFEVQFKRETTDEGKARIAAVRATESSDDANYVAPIIVGFRKLLDGLVEGTEVPFNPDTLAALLALPGAGTAIAMAHADSTDQIARKN